MASVNGMPIVLYGSSVLWLLILRLLVLWLLILRLLVLWLLVLLLALALEAHHELASTVRTLDEFLFDVEFVLDIKLNMTLRTDNSNYFHVVVVY